MKRLIGVILALCLFRLTVPAAMVQAAVPEVSAQAWILTEAATGQVLCEQNAREKRPMASTTKIMTTLLTIEHGDLDTEFCVDPDAIRVEGSSMGLQEGDIVTLRALCYGMLLPSGNDAANAAAVRIAGSIPDFAVRMNARAKEIGMQNTFFVTPSGLEGEGHGASAYDMALLTREAMRSETFRSMCCEQAKTLRFGNPPYERTLYNSNKLLKLYDGVIGVKTGFTDEAGRCLVSACERDGVTLICVTLHAADDWNDHMRLYDYGFSRIRPAVLPAPALPAVPVAGGVQEKTAVQPAESVTIGAPDGIPSGIRTAVRRAPFAYAPVCEGDVLGALVYYYQEREIASVPLIAAENVPARPAEHPKKHIWERLWKPARRTS
ncbi:MAG: D-alanyl-D-alanine carboxypeptidase [Oscillospiraceae bacterium]|nr:D-alanyl-D-alanine carboxypeptidase [Oscillospiraceae bacterium]